VIGQIYIDQIGQVVELVQEEDRESPCTGCQYIKWWHIMECSEKRPLTTPVVCGVHNGIYKLVSTDN